MAAQGPDSGSSAKMVELQAKLDAKTAELATAAKREQAFREALEKAKKNLTDADSARMALEEDLAKVLRCFVSQRLLIVLV